MTTRALVCSGGGALGAWQGGVIQALTEEGKSWTSFAGVSVGSLNAAFMSQASDQAAQAIKLKDLWWNVKGNSDIYKPQAPWLLKWIWQFWKRSLYTMKPLEEMVFKNYIPKKTYDAGNQLSVGMTNLQTGEYHSYPEQLQSRRDAAIDIHASCVFPGLFEPVKIGQYLYIDGGVRNTIPIIEVLAQGVDEIDIILTAPRFKMNYEKKFKSAIDVGLRAANIMANEVYRTDLAVIGDKYQAKFHIYEPVEDLHHDPFEFDPMKIREMWHEGYVYGISKELL